MGFILSRIIDLYSFLILVRILMNWFPHNRYNRYVILLNQATDIVLVPARTIFERLGVNTGMIDFSPIIAILFLRLLSDIVRVVF